MVILESVFRAAVLAFVGRSFSEGPLNRIGWCPRFRFDCCCCGSVSEFEFFLFRLSDGDFKCSLNGVNARLEAFKFFDELEGFLIDFN